MNPNACVKSLNWNMRCRFPLTTLQPLSVRSPAAISCFDNFPLFIDSPVPYGPSVSIIGSSLDAGVGWVVVEHVVLPAPLATADPAEVVDELNPVDPLGHLVAELVLDPEPQGSPVRDCQGLPVHLVREDHLRPVRGFD